MKLFVSIIFISLSLVTTAQNLEKQLMDTIDFVFEKIASLENSEYDYELVRLNFDNCNLELHQVPKSDSTKYDFFALWLMDLDESKMKILEQPSGEWGLILETSEQWKIKYVSEKDSGRKNHIVLFSYDKQLIVDIGQAIYYSIRLCREMGRESDY
ncbi:hypothetical protein AAOE16_07390 [Ekhidna sp. MALMAid0563]|uniref:hypothetical protein n=1 Tax=Ekhidna sp. MALMAid0563 TaxID=3143937 RepID=UPI0032DF1515